MKHKANCSIHACFLMLSFLAVSGLHSQTKETTVKKIYLQLGIGGCTYNGFASETGIQAAFKNNWIASFSYHKMEEMKPNNIPADYKPQTGEGEFLFFPYSYTSEVDNINISMVSLTGGKYFKLGRKVWATTEAGVSLVNGEKINFKSTPVKSGTLSYLLGWENYTTSNYETVVEKKTTIGAMLKADINWAFASFMGIGAGVYANINSIQSPVGAQLKLIIGKMGRVKKHKS